MQQVIKICQNCKQNFVIEAEDFNFYEKIQVPAPTFCPLCRFQRRLAFWNKNNLFRKKEANSGKEIFSTFPEASPLKIYEHDYWWSDAWDPMDYGRDYDFSKPFFEQFKDLYYAVPWAARSVQKMVNSDYCDQATGFKNCYLCFNGNYSEDCMYASDFNYMKNSMDFYQSGNSELCYEVFSSVSSYQLFFSFECGDCHNVWFSLNCIGCTDCFGCVNLRNKQYHIFNKPYSKEEYFKKVEEFNRGSYLSLVGLRKRAYDFWLQYPMKYMHAVHNSNVSGDYVYDSKNAKRCYEVVAAEDVKYVQNTAGGIKDAYDYTNWGNKSELMYEAISCGENCRNIKFCFDCWPNCSDLEYCMNCHSSSNLFGCVGLKKKQYCIFNRQYTPDEYERRVSRIREHMNEMPYKDKKGRIYKYGELFPAEISPLAYNESVVNDYLPLKKEEAIRQGFLWRDPSLKEYEVSVKATDLPDRIEDAPDNIIKEIIACNSCHKAYRILPAELEFYKRFTIPLPRLCYICRYLERIKFRNSFRWYKRQCMCDYEVFKNFAKHEGHLEGRCPNEFETNYAPSRPEIIYCEKCYQVEVD